ncbi:MAG: hypothetical protein ACHQXG_02290 [Nitrososphaerales archaeon]
MVDRKGSLANALSIHDKQLTIENGNAIVGALLGIIGIILVYLGFYSRFSTMNV